MWYHYFISLSTAKTLFSMKDFVLKFYKSANSGIKLFPFPFLYCFEVIYKCIYHVTDNITYESRSPKTRTYIYSILFSIYLAVYTVNLQTPEYGDLRQENAPLTVSLFRIYSMTKIFVNYGNLHFFFWGGGGVIGIFTLIPGAECTKEA